MSSGHVKKAKPQSPRQFHPLTVIGLTCIAAACFIVFTTYWPIIATEIGYDIRTVAPKISAPRPIQPIDRNYGIVIPKIGANAHVIANVDPFNSRAYQAALSKGVAQARGSGTPGQPGNVFLFSHSSVNFYEATIFNSVFYLVDKLAKGDLVQIYYKNTVYLYRVTDKVFVKPNAVQYLKPITNKETVTLMTCWPPGTSYERLLVIAEREK